MLISKISRASISSALAIGILIAGSTASMADEASNLQSQVVGGTFVFKDDFDRTFVIKAITDGKVKGEMTNCGRRGCETSSANGTVKGNEMTIKADLGGRTRTFNFEIVDRDTLKRVQRKQGITTVFKRVKK